MADKASRALVVYGDGLADLVSPLHSHLHSFVSRASCGFLSLRDPPDAQESENARRIREIAQLLDVYDFYTAMKGHHAEMNISKDKDDLSVPTISQRFMGLRAAIFTDCIDVGSFASKLGFTVSQLSELIKRVHAGVNPCENFDNNATVLELLKLLGFSGGEVLEDYDYDLVFLHITPDHKLNDEKSGKAINTDINFFNKFVGGVVNAAHPGSLVASRLHFSVVLSYGAVSGSDQSCSLNLNLFTETNSDLLLLCPHQSYTMKGGNILPDIRHHHPMLIAQWQEGVTRRDIAMKFCFDDFRERPPDQRGCLLDIQKEECMFHICL
ncbi:uncharacterized protein LOC122010098 isoform X2 [Zingiber officinale]|uniref:uncharacterized protein LOC122010098 isoform X2 n=1 Tax=Zingiber officinale TaxID=94328 RepID=UPI001C4D25DA|nr:uncharacterized protein LOC122010098 isoform X2 [Zingiber officinale]